MSFELDAGTRPEGLRANGLPDCVLIGDGQLQLRISMIDLLCLTEYALTNSDLSGQDDPRITFVRHLKDMHIGPGISPGQKKLLPTWIERESFLNREDTRAFMRNYAAAMQEMERRESASKTKGVSP